MTVTLVIGYGGGNRGKKEKDLIAPSSSSDGRDTNRISEKRRMRDEFIKKEAGRFLVDELPAVRFHHFFMGSRRES